MSESNSVPVLPQEIVERIIDQLAPQIPPEANEESGAYDALIACTLVNKSFSSWAKRRILVHIIIEDTKYKIDSLHSALQSAQEPWHHIQSLSILIRRQFANPAFDALTGLLSLFFANQVPLKRLTLSFDKDYPGTLLDLWNISQDFQNSILQLGKLRTLTKLHLKSINMPIAFLAQFSNVRKLVLEDGSLITGPTSQNALLDLEELEIKSCDCSSLVQFLSLCKDSGLPRPDDNTSGNNPSTNLKSLKYHPIHFNRPRFSESFCEAFRWNSAISQLESLELATTFAQDYQVPALLTRSLDLHELPRLRSFKMKSILVGARKDLKNNILRFVFLPTPKGPTRLETIQLSLVIPTSTQVFEELVKEPFAWPRLEPFRTKDEWKRLHTNFSDVSQFPCLHTAEFSLIVYPVARSDNSDDALNSQCNPTPRLTLRFSILRSADLTESMIGTTSTEC